MNGSIKMMKDLNRYFSKEYIQVGHEKLTTWLTVREVQIKHNEKPLPTLSDGYYKTNKQKNKTPSAGEDVEKLGSLLIAGTNVIMVQP